MDQERLERRTRHNFLLLVATCVLAPLGLGIALFPMLGSFGAHWPWGYTHHALLGALILTVACLASYLADQERRASQLRSQFAAMQGREIAERARTERDLRAFAQGLEERVAERTAATERQAEQLALIQEYLVDQNRRLRELYSTSRQFVDNVSHEFRTPLTVIREYASFVRDELDGDQEALVPYLDTVVARVDDLDVLVGDLLDLSRIEAGLVRTRRRVCRLDAILHDVTQGLVARARRSGVAVEIAPIPEALPPVYCDEDKITRVLLNLTVNGIKFSEPGKSVRLWAHARPDSSEVTIGVTDQGPGIAPEHMELIFERFKQVGAASQASTLGFGLGLSIVKELVHLNFGTIQVRSQLGHGSTFVITVPAAEPRRFLPLYLERVSHTGRPCKYVSLLSVAAVGDAETAEFAALLDFLESQLRASDLIFAQGPGSWLLVAAMPHRNVREVIKRIDKAHAEASRARTSPFPALRWHDQGTWSLGEQSTEIAEVLAAMIQLPDPGAPAGTPSDDA